MATKEQVEYVLKYLEKFKPQEVFKQTSEVNAGIGAVIKILSESHGAVSAGTISEKVGISTARTAVLLKKMVKHNLITKSRADFDGRKTMVVLTEYGLKTAEEMQKNLLERLEKTIDAIGMDKIEKFISLFTEIQAFIKSNFPKPPKF